MADGRSKIRIRFEELPPRVRVPGEDEMREIFGGCAGFAWPCDEDCDCCALYVRDIEGNRAYCNLSEPKPGHKGTCRNRF